MSDADLRWFLEHPPASWAEHRPLRAVRVAVVDSGIDATHPDLAQRVAEAWKLAITGPEREIQAESVPVPTANDACGHGTGVAGIVAATAANAEIIDVRVLDSNGCTTGDVLIAGFERAIETGAEVINLSLAGRARLADRLYRLCERAYRGRQIVVASKRNMPLKDHGFPAELSSVVAIDNAELDGWTLRYRADDPIEFAANGQSVVTAAMGGGYTRHTGTSFATPLASGLAALARGIQRELTPFELKTIFKCHGSGT